MLKARADEGENLYSAGTAGTADRVCCSFGALISN